MIAHPRRRFQVGAILLLTLAWMLLWGSASPLTIAGGLVVSWIITRVFWLPPIRYRGRVRPWALLTLVLVVMRDLAVASVRLAVVALRPGIRLTPGIVRVDLRGDHDLYQVALAHLISIVPGTLAVDMGRHPRCLYLHAFNLPDAAAVTGVRANALALEARLMRAFASTQELREAAARGAASSPDHSPEPGGDPR